MKKLTALLLVAFIIAAFAGCGSNPGRSSETAAEETTAIKETLAQDVKAKLDQALSQEEFKGVAQITKGSDVIYQYVNGDDDNGKPLTIDSSLPLASASKQFCAACIMQLSEKNKLSLDDTLDKYYPEYKDGKKITIKNLLNMSSGLTEYYEAFMDGSSLGTDEAENVKKIKEAIFSEELDIEPGKDYEYTNSNYFLLADIVEQVSGTAYHDYLRTNIFEPLDMTHTGFVEEIKDDPEWASAFSKTELLNETTCPGLTKGAGDIVSNAEDMDKWLRGLSGGEAVSPESFRQMTENVNPDSAEDYGYGLYVIGDGYGHLGQMPPSYGAVDYLNTDSGVYLFAATNDPRGSSYVQQLPQDLTDILSANQ